MVQCSDNQTTTTLKSLNLKDSNALLDNLSYQSQRLVLEKYFWKKNWNIFEILVQIQVLETLTYVQSHLHTALWEGTRMPEEYIFDMKTELESYSAKGYPLLISLINIHNQPFEINYWFNKMHLTEYLLCRIKLDWYWLHFNTCQGISWPSFAEVASVNLCLTGPVLSNLKANHTLSHSIASKITSSTRPMLLTTVSCLTMFTVQVMV